MKYSKDKIFKNRYKILSCLGAGGMGETYLVYDEIKKERQSLKLLYETETSFIDNFKQEFNILAKFNHPNLVKVFEFVSDEEFFYTMEYVDGINIIDYFKKNNILESSKLYPALSQILLSLDYIHTRKIVHGDLKPDNILVSKGDDGKPFIKLLDFGLSFNFDVSSDHGFKGTPEYCSPEKIRGERIDGRSDLYSLGVVIYELLVGMLPFKNDNILTLIKNQLYTEVNEIPSLTSISEDFERIILRLLYKEPSKRYYSGYEVANDISQISDGKIVVDEKETSEYFLSSGNFTGRESELQEILDLFGKIKDKSHFLSIYGESGIGKTRILKEFKIFVQINNCDYFNTLCSSQISKAYAAIFDIFQQILSRYDFDESFNAKYQEIIANINADQEKDFSKTSDSVNEKTNFILSLIDFLVEIGQVHPMVIAIDNLEDADSGTIEFISFLQQNLYIQDSKNILFCVSYQTESMNKIQSLVSDFENNNFSKRIELRRIGIEEIRKYLSDSLGIDKVSEKVLDKIFVESSGNFYFIEEILKDLLANRFLVRKNSRWTITEDLEIPKYPTSISEIFKKRFDKYDKDEKNLLFVLSLFSTKFDIQTIQMIVSDKNDEISDKVNKFHEDDVLIRERSFYYFKNQKFREIIYDQLDLEQKRSFHSTFAKYYHKLFHDCRDKYSELFAYHYFNAGEYNKAFDYLLLSGEKSKSVFSNDEAKEHFQKALFVLDKNGEACNVQKYNIYSDLYDIFDLTGQRDDQFDTIENMLNLSNKLSDDHKISDVYVKQSKYYIILGQYEKARKVAEKAKEYKTIINDQKGKAESLVLIGFSLYRIGEVQSFLSYYDEAIRIFSEEKCDLEYGNALIDVGIAYWDSLNSPEKAIEYYEKAYRIFDDFKNMRGKIRATGNMGLAYSTLGDYDKSMAYYEKTYQICHDLGDRRGISIVMVNLGKTLLTLGKYSDALEKFEEGLKLSKIVKDEYSETRCFENLGIIYNYLGKYDKAIEYFNEALLNSEKMKSNIAINYSNIALCYINKNDPETAYGFLKKARALIKEDTDNYTKINIFIPFIIYYLKSRVRENFNLAVALSEDVYSLAKKSSDIDSEIYSLTTLAMANLLLDEYDLALEHSNRTVSLINDSKFIAMDETEIFWNHYLILTANEEKEKALESLEKAYDSVIKRKENILDLGLKESFLENVSMNKNIISEYKKVILSDPTSDIFTQTKMKNLETLYEISRTITSILDFDDLLNTIMDLALQTLKGKRGMIFLMEDGVLNLKIARNVEKQTIQDASEISDSILKDVVAGGKPIITMNAKDDDRFKKRLSIMNFQITSLVCVPIKLKEKILGTVYIDCPTTPDSIVAFTNIDLEFLEAFANIAAISIENARLLDHFKAENTYLRKEVEEKFRFENIIGRSEVMQKVYKIMEGAINSDGTVLIQGDSGTGKELVARAIHYNGQRKKEKFIAIDCAALHETLLDSELFGHKKGSFTGAISDKKGLFEEADGGTIFLDEITNTGLAFQAKLLRVLQEGEIRRVGDTESKYVNVRVIVAANKNVESEIKENKFREDLFYRLNVIPIFVPTLKDRKEDIPLLINHFVNKYTTKTGKLITNVSQELIDRFINYSWPGNIRELENIINRMIIFAEDKRLSIKDIPSDFLSALNISQQMKSSVERGSLDDLGTSKMSEIEKLHILRILEQTDGNKTEAAKILGLKRTTLIERMKKMKIM